MPRRKGYGIPPTKRIKNGDDIENDENETNNTSCENAVVEAQKTQDEKYAKETESHSSKPCPNGAIANGIKYLHKKFKKMAAVLSDDNASSSPGVSVVVARTEVVNSNSAEDKSTYLSPTPQPACSPIALPTSTPNLMAAAVATTSITAALPSEDKPSATVPGSGSGSGSAGRYACSYCPLTCNKPSVLQKHIRAHTNERPYPCQPCGFAFKTRSNLYKHCRSRSHYLKVEEIGEGGEGVGTGASDATIEMTGASRKPVVTGKLNNNESRAFVSQDEEADDEDVARTQSTKEEDTTSGEERAEQPLKSSIYKPKFHKAAIYIQSRELAEASKPEQTVSTTSNPNPLNKLGLQLKILTTSAPAAPPSSRSTPSTPSSFGGGSPSPEFLQRHISKLISENQAIVETTDPFWSRKFYRKENGRSVSLSDINSCSSGSSSSSSAGNSNTISCSSGSSSVAITPASTAEESPQPLNLTVNRDTAKFVRPTSLPLQPGTFVPKKLLPGAVAVLPLISPETPRPNKSYGQLYIGGNAYTYLGLKCSTRSTFCTLLKSQPTYVPLSPELNKVSMYSNWKVRSEVDPYLRTLSATKVMACYDSRQQNASYVLTRNQMKDLVTHSSFWLRSMKMKSVDGPNDGDDEDRGRMQSVYGEEGPLRVTTQAGGDEEESREKDRNVDYSEEREVAESLMLLSKISHQKASEQHANDGLVSLNARPNSYPYNYSAIMSSKPHTPTLTFISEQKERETVSKNTGLARDLQPVSKSGSTMTPKCDRPSQTGDRFYFGSSSEKKLAKVTPDLQESVRTKDSVTVTSDFPVDLSSRNTLVERKIIVPTVLNGFSATADGLPSPAAVASEILTPVSESTLLATICSTIPPPPSPASTATDVGDGSTLMLQTYLKERAVQDLKMKQQYQSPHIKMEQRDFDVKFNAYNEAFQKGAAAAAAAKPSIVYPTTSTAATDKAVEPVRPVLSPKRKRPFPCESTDADITTAAPPAFVVRNEAKSAERVSDSAAKDTPAADDSADKSSGDCSTSVILMVGSSNSGTSNPPKRLKAEFISPGGGPMPKYASVADGRNKCVACDKVFPKLSQLRLHVNVHYMEHPFRCESCAVSFRTKGHLHKHLGSNSHVNKVNMNSTGYGQTLNSNPRPFKCDDCSVGFRIHGHLAKHLRSKMHIMKLECLGKLPFGTYAEMERCGINMNDIDTTDCENSLESLQRIAKGVVGSVVYVNTDEDAGKMITDNASF